MEEKILHTKKNGMTVLLLTLLGFVVDVVAFVFAVRWMEIGRMLIGVPVLILSILYLLVGILLLCGLKVLKPQEALVLTLFGDYIGTLKGEGFYWINPFCTAVNPAAGTRLSQSGDVGAEASAVVSLKVQNAQAASEMAGKKKIGRAHV